MRTSPLFVYILIAHVVRGDWDIGVVTENRLELLTSEGATITAAGHEMLRMEALAYDPIYGHFYFSDSQTNPNASIFKMEVARDGRTSKIIPLSFSEMRKPDVKVEGIAHDPLTSQLFWTTGKLKTIWAAQLSETINVRVFLEFNDSIPNGIAVDSCQGFVYWTNCDLQSPSIERVRLDGSGLEKIVDSKLNRPKGLVISESERMIYWVDDLWGQFYAVDRASLDGSHRERVVYGTHQQPVAIAVGRGAIFWTDFTERSIYTVELTPGLTLPVEKPARVKKFTTGSPNGIVAAAKFDVLVERECRNLLDLKTKVPSRMNVTLGTCLHGRTLESGDGCVCASGFTGEHCEVAVCYNFCLYGGTCTLTEPNYAPVCSCPPQRTGKRCEVELCPSDYCLNKGHCSIGLNFETRCDCGVGYFGSRCQLTESVCRALCKSSDEDKKQCPCDRWETTDNPTDTLVALLNNSKEAVNRLDTYKIICWSLSAVTGALVVLAVVLTAYSCRLRRRPRLVRRYQVTPQKPALSPSCEIAIENCCNMNICDTPCYEPEFRAPSQKDNKSKKEEKRTLLSSEVTPGQSPVLIRPNSSSAADLF